MLTQESVFVQVLKENSKSYTHEIEVTNLCPEYFVDIRYDKELYKANKLLEEEEEITTSFLSNQVDAHKTKGLEESRNSRKRESRNSNSTLVEILSVVEPPLKASAMLQGIPMRKLTTWQWKVYQFFSIFWLCLHSSVMIWSMIDAQQELKSCIQKNLTSSESLAYSVQYKAADIFLLFYAWLVFVCAAALPCGRVFQKCLKQSLIVQTYEQSLKAAMDKGILNNFTKILEFVSEQTDVIIPLVFAVSSLATLAQGKSVDQHTYASWKGAFLLFGWLIVLIPARTYSPIYNFISTLKVIFLNDMVPFFGFFFIITLAFACAIYLQFQLLLNDAFSQGHGSESHVTRSTTHNLLSCYGTVCDDFWHGFRLEACV